MTEGYDEIHKAKHYNEHPSGVECIQVIRHHTLNIGNVIKYVWRAGLKDSSSDGVLKDLYKAHYYLVDEIKRLGGSVNAEEQTRLNQRAEASKSVERLRAGCLQIWGPGVISDKEAIAKGVEDLLMKGLKLDDPPEAIFVPGVSVVHKGGWKGIITIVQWARHLPLHVVWDKTQPEGSEPPGKFLSGDESGWFAYADFALDADPVPVTLDDLAAARTSFDNTPSEAVPANPAATE